jgi:peptide/nickel transport system permease protein
MPENQKQPEAVRIADTVATDMGTQIDSPLNTGVVGAAAIPGVGTPSPVGGRLRDFWRIVTVNRKVTIGFFIIVFFVLVSIFGPLLVHQDPNALSNETLMPPSAQHWLGTTQTGQDVFAQLVYGTQSSIFWGFLTGVAVTIISLVIGLAAGYFGGVVDDIISLFTNIFILIPGLPLALVLAAFFPFKGLITVSLVIIITGWPWNARVIRAQTLSMRNRDFVESARANGENIWRILFSEILPNEISIIMAGLIGAVISAIVTSVGLQFIGLGKATDVTWGTMLYLAQNGDALFLGAWWWIIPPGLCVAFVAAALSLINYGVDEVANPKLRSEPQPKKVKAKLAAKAEKNEKAVA